MNILLYGNCQTWAIYKTIIFPCCVKVKHIECFSTSINEEDFNTLIKSSDIIITQPINDNYRGRDYLSTSYIINNAKTSAKIIIIESLYFNFYYPDFNYKLHNSELLRTPSDYHYNGIFDSVKKLMPVEYYIKHYIDNPVFKTVDELNDAASKSLEELKIRHENICIKYGDYKNVNIINSYNYIKNNYKKKLLFYSINHPTKYLIQFISKEICNIINPEYGINENVDVLANNNKGILYTCIQQVVEFNIIDYKPLLLGKTDIADIFIIYRDTYSKILN